jgi:signal transduction protein with GAF and PtsI domain
MTKELKIDGRTSVGTPIEQVQVIVDSISKVIGVDVCCLYRLKNNHGMELVASHELDYEGPVTIPAGKRLVGLVAKNWLPISIADASKHLIIFITPRLMKNAAMVFVRCRWYVLLRLWMR